MQNRFPYEDIIDLPPHISEQYPQPSMADRAARFAPFAAITGYEEMVLEEARITQMRKELDENTLSILNEKLNVIREFLYADPITRITYFQPDPKKIGGSYLSITGIVKRIDEYKRLITMADGRKIPIDEISDIESELLDHI